MNGRTWRRAGAGAVAALCLASAGGVGAQLPDGSRAEVVAEAVQVTEPIRVDGRLDEAAWSTAPLLAGFTQREPAEGRPVSERTEVRVLFDDEALYIGGWLYDAEVDGIVAGENRRDADLEDTDALIVVLDTYRDRQNAFVFGTTPAGIEYDGQVTREGEGSTGAGVRQQRGSGGGFNKNWDGSWRVATTRDGAGWYAELRIPFSTLRYAQGGPQQWGFNVARRIRRRNEEAFWSPIPRQFDLNRVSLAGTLALAQAPANLPRAITPFVTGRVRRDYLTQSRFESDLEVGGDAKIGLTPSLTLDLTVNTDFAQVEVDDEQVNLTRFPLFFPEKRPFFLENAGTFAVGTPQEVEIFFSRRIGIAEGVPVPIVAGGRMTGRVGGFTVGLLDIQTDGVRTFDPVGDSSRVLAPPNNFSVVRALRELPNRSRVGFAVVNRINTDDAADYNVTLAADGRLGVGEAFQFDGYAARSISPGEAAGGENTFGVTGAWTVPLWRVTAAFRQVDESFNPEVGFVNRDGYRFSTARVQRNFRFPALTWFRELRPHLLYREFRDLSGFQESGFLHIDSHFEFANGAFFQLPALNWVREGLKAPFEIAPGIVVPPGTYDGWEWGFAYNSDLSAPLSVEGRVDVGAFYTGHRKGTASSLNARLGEHFVGSLRVNWYDVDLAEGSFQTTVLGMRAAWSFSPSVYLQSLVQWNNQSRNFSSNVRLGWLATAGTGLFIVYNDVEHYGSLERTGYDRGPQERAFIVKFTRQIGR